MIAHHFLSGLNEAFLGLLFALIVVYLVSGLDDFFIDVVAWAARLRPTRLTTKEHLALHFLPERNIAIIVPAWDEGSIIDRMLAGNISRIDYQRYHFFIGVYPNDPATVKKVKEVQLRYPHVHPVVNFKNGPSSKGQILNYVVQEILQYEKETGTHFDALLMQDSEDLIHPKTLKLVNASLRKYDFIQIPVFSLEVKAKQLVAGTYVDEFAESHTKDILVREYLGAAVPSAGVGTALSRNLVLSMLAQNDGQLFNEGTVTEDYQLGVRAHALGFKPHFAAHSYIDPQTGKPDFIATREFFPKRFSRSVRQKTRWTVGIALQGWRDLGWVGNFANQYFLARDRKGPVTNIATFLGYPTVLATALYAWLVDSGPAAYCMHHPLYRAAIVLNVFLMVNRFVQRTICVSRVYGLSAAVPIIVRWPLGGTINALASFHAVKNNILAHYKKATIAWAKTDHELPAYFGQPTQNLEVVR